jgi:hypothetical protein
MALFLLVIWQGREEKKKRQIGSKGVGDSASIDSWHRAFAFLPTLVNACCMQAGSES